MEKFRWIRKRGTGAHSLVVDGKRIRVKPGESVVCTMQQLGSDFIRKAYVQQDLAGKEVDVIDVTDLASEFKLPTKTLELKARKRGGFYDIVNPDNPDKPLNSKALRLEEAKDVLQLMLSELEGNNIVEDQLDELDWDQLVARMEAEGIEMSDDYTTEADLRTVLRKGK